MTQEIWSIVIQSFIGPGLVVAAGFLWFWARAPFALWSEALEGERPSGPPEDKRLARWVSRRTTFNLAEAACLLAEQPLTDGEIVGVASGYLADIKQAILNGEVAPVGLSGIELTLLGMHKGGGRGLLSGPYPPDVRDDLVISSEDFKALALKYGVQVPGLD